MIKRGCRRKKQLDRMKAGLTDAERVGHPGAGLHVNGLIYNMAWARMRSRYQARETEQRQAGHTQRHSTHFYGALNLVTGRETVLRSEIMTADATALFLQQVLDLYPGVPIVMLWDRATWHYGPVIRCILEANPRLVSRQLLTRDVFRPATTLNLLAAAWLQFMVHDWLSHGRNDKDNLWQVPLPPDDDWPENPMRILRTRTDPTRPPGDDGYLASGARADAERNLLVWLHDTLARAKALRTKNRPALQLGRDLRQRRYRRGRRLAAPPEPARTSGRPRPGNP